MRHVPVIVTWFPETVTEPTLTSLMVCPVPLQDRGGFADEGDQDPRRSLALLLPRQSTRRQFGYREFSAAQE